MVEQRQTWWHQADMSGLRALVIAAIAACLLFGLWALWQFPTYAQQMPPRILPNGSWTTTAARAALSSLGWTVETYLWWRLGFISLTAVFYIGLGLFVLRRCRRDRFGLLFALSLVLFGVGSNDLPFVLEQWGYWGDRLAYGLAALAYGLLNFLVFLFPDGRFVPRQMRWVGAVTGLFIVYVGFLQPQPTRPLAPYLSVISFFLLLLGVLGQIYRYRVVGTAVQRQQMKWVLWAIVLNLVFKLLLNFIYASPAVNAINGQGMWYSLLRTTSLNLVTATIPVAVTFAILRYRLWDIDIIIRKTVVYGIMIVCVTSLYVLVVGYLGFLFQVEEENLVFSLTAASLVAVLFTPLKNYVEQQINRLFFGQRDEPYQLLTRLSQQLESALNPAAALSVTAETVAQALKLPYVAIVLQQGDEMQATAVYGAPQNEISRYPLTYAGQMMGELQTASRSPKEPLPPTDQRLLADLAHQLGAAAHAVLLTTNLEQARLRLVTERGEARRQLGSDLHDRVGHELVSLTRQLEHAMTLIHADPAQAQAQLAAINQQLAALTKQVRGLAHQLYPPELELLGLVGALRERAETQVNLHVYLDAPENLPRLPAEIETAVYYITLEALTNIEKHAQAQTCHVRLNLSAASQPCILELDIQDNGRGLAEPSTSGLGLLSMQARAAEVGGICVIGAHAGGGTAVTARIPCPIQVR